MTSSASSATAVQVVPHLGADAKELYVFQRTPSSVGERNNRSTDPAYAKAMLSAPGWQRERMVNFVKMTQTPDPTVDDLIQDGTYAV